MLMNMMEKLLNKIRQNCCWWLWRGKSFAWRCWSWKKNDDEILSHDDDDHEKDDKTRQIRKLCVLHVMIINNNNNNRSKNFMFCITFVKKKTQTYFYKRKSKKEIPVQIPQNIFLEQKFLKKECDMRISRCIIPVE